MTRAEMFTLAYGEIVQDTRTGRFGFVRRIMGPAALVVVDFGDNLWATTVGMEHLARPEKGEKRDQVQ